MYIRNEEIQQAVTRNEIHRYTVCLRPTQQRHNTLGARHLVIRAGMGATHCTGGGGRSASRGGCICASSGGQKQVEEYLT